MIYKVDFEGQACKQIKEKAESYQYDLKSVLKGIGLLIADMWLPGDSKPQINTWEGLFEKVQEDYSYKDTIVENDFICSISNDDGISIIIEIADETIVDFKDIKSSILQVRDFLLANKWSGAIPDFLPIEQKEIRNMMNETERSIPFKCLHEAFFECAYRFPDKTALEWLSLDEKWETLSYEALKIKVLQTASMLKQEGVHTRDKVAIVLPKGENQIIAVLAILSIGATYVPIGIHQPLDRKKKIFEAGNISYALTDRDHINTLDGADTLRSFLIENSFRYVVMPETEIVKDIDSIAYIIFTSGTTGIPKGVMITHKAAYNTIYDVNDKFTINEHDCAIAVSELDFDLSVYDIFGMLGYGASLIVLNEMNKREPYIWKKILCEKRVTIWNSVPALFEMFLLAIGYDYEKVTLKNILLSGDWIKLEIYPKVNKLWPECRFVSLGGATEAAIWSVYYEVHILDEQWSHCVFDLCKWPLYNIRISYVNKAFPRIHIDFDCIIMDAWSAKMMIAKIFEVYEGKIVKWGTYSFKQYCLEQKEYRETHPENAAYSYWRKRVTELPPAPDLPYKKKLSELCGHRFDRISQKFSREETSALYKLVKDNRVTPAALICTMYMKTLMQYSKNKEFSLNLTLFNRLPLSEEIYNLIGDFTNIGAIAYRQQKDFWQEVNFVQKQLWELVRYHSFDGTQILKMIDPIGISMGLS
ncbi:TPA: AMP-binding protein [Enterococcus faecium]|nr:AMP-binding protein [Enterococcus faecium]